MRILTLSCLGLLAATASAQEAVPVLVAHPIAYDASHVEYIGKMEPARAIAIRSGVTSKVARVLVKPGSKVAHGEPILELDREPVEARVRQWEQNVAQAGADVSRAQKRLEAAEQLAKMDAAVLARLRAEELRLFQEAGARAQTACQKLALTNPYWKSQGDFRTARETLAQTLALCKSRPPGSDSFAQAQRLRQALNKVPARPLPLDKECAAEFAGLTDMLDRMMLLCRAGTPQGREALKAEVALAQTVLRSAEQGRDQERATLRQTTITAPIDGLVQRIVKVGDPVVGGERSATLLARIIQVDAVRATFAVDEICYLKYRQLVKLKDRPVVPIALGREADKGFPFPGKIEFIDNQIDPQKNVGVVRAVFDNRQGKLTDALLTADRDRLKVRVRITLSESQKVVLVPWQIVQTNRDGSQQAMVVRDGQVEIRRIKLAGQLGNRQIVAEGLSPDDLVILGSPRRDFKDQTLTAEDFAADVRSLRAGTPVVPVLAVLPRLPR